MKITGRSINQHRPFSGKSHQECTQYPKAQRLQFLYQNIPTLALSPSPLSIILNAIPEISIDQ